jgi:hypothetical protein
MKIEELEYSSWVDFKARIISDQFTDGHFQRGRFLFRGQGGESWPLSSSFDRWYKGDRANKVKVADQLLDQFTKECELENIPDQARQDKVLMLSLAQHNGLPTRLLDWSESPYVAAFFAFSGHIRHGINLEKNVAIWVLYTGHEIWNSEFGCQIVNVPSFGNERIRNQHGRFTYLKAPYDSIEEYVSQFNGEATALRKYTVPVRDAAAAMADLDSMGLNHSRIYPGISGNAKAAEVRVLLGMGRTSPPA